MNGSDRSGGGEQATTVVPTRRVNSDDWRVGNVGLLLLEAAKQGSVDSLKLLLGLPQGIIEQLVEVVLAKTDVFLSHLRIPIGREQIDYTDGNNSEVS